MDKPRRWPAILTFIIIQIAWVCIVLIWIIWYIIKYNSMRIKPIGTWDIVIMVEVSVLLLLVLAGIYVLFILYQRQLNLMRTQMHFISSITHAFKTPLATMQLYLETIQKRALKEEVKQQLLSGMMVETQRLKSLVDNFLASARLSYSRRPYVFQNIPVSQFLNSFLEKHEVLLKDVKISCTIHEDVTIPLDNEAMNLVFANLAENAIHYSTDIPHVEIEVRREKKHAYVSFSDSGIGIPKERHRDIFKLFQRLPDAMSMWGSGTGIGLYVVRMIIKAHGGTIKVSSSTIDKSGTSFLIRLPVAK